MPPTRNSIWRDDSEIHVLSSDCSTARSAESRLVSSPVRRSVKNPGDSRTRCANTSSRSLAIDALRRGREQVDLDEIHRALQREQRDQPERDPVEQRAVALLERRVEQVAHDVREREPDAGRDDETDRADRERAAIRAHSRHDGGQRCGRDGLPRPRDDARRERCVARGGGTGHVSALLAFAAEPQPQRVERLIHRASRRALLLEPLQERTGTLRARTRRRAPVVRRPDAHVHHVVGVGRTDQQQHLRRVALAPSTGAARAARSPSRRHATRRSFAGHAIARSTTIAAKSSAR